MRKFINIGRKCAPLIFFIALLLLWEVVVHIKGIEPYILPAPSAVVEALLNDRELIVSHSIITVYEALTGFLISIVLSLALGAIMDSFKIVKRCMYPLLVVSQTVPIIALAPLFIIWFGFGTLPKIIVVVLVCFFPMVISLVDGMGGVDRSLIEHFRLMGASKLNVFLNLKLPYGLLNFFSGMRISATYSIMGAVIGEWLGAQNGLGIYMVRAKSAYALDKVFAAIVVIVILSISFVALIKVLEKVCTPWNNKKIEVKK